MTALLDTADIAAMLKLEREYVTDKLTKRADFPAPAVNLSRRLRRWKESDILAWIETTARTKPARKSPSPVNG